MITFFKWVLISLVIILVIANGYLLISGNQYIYKALLYNFADVDDYKKFSNRVIKASDHPEPWPLSKNYNQQPLSKSLLLSLEASESLALLILKNDSIVREKYWQGYSQNSYSGSFSVAKSYVGALIGVALKEGKIKSLDQPVSDFLPWFREGEKQKITIKHLLTMSSGLEWDEAYASPFSVTTEAYYGSNLERLFVNQKVQTAPGLTFDYKSGDTQLLGFILEKATGKSLAEYAEEKLWKPMGAEKDALWSLDKDNGREKAYCCINSNARDFARLGSLYLHRGNWRGRQLIDSAYVIESTTSNPARYGDKNCTYYGYQWWIIPGYETEVFYARGILGQFVIIVPEWNMIAVRLGENKGERRGKHFTLIFEILNEMKRLK